MPKRLVSVSLPKLSGWSSPRQNTLHCRSHPEAAHTEASKEIEEYKKTKEAEFTAMMPPGSQGPIRRLQVTAGGIPKEGESCNSG